MLNQYRLIACLFSLGVFGGSIVHAIPPLCKSTLSILDPVLGRVYVPRGDGVADDTQAIQNAMDYSVCIKGANGITCSKPCPPPGKVVFPAPPKGYLVASLNIHPGQTLVGPGMRVATLVGNGKGVLINALSAPFFSLEGINLFNKNFPAVKIDKSSNFNISQSYIVSDGRSVGGVNGIEITDSYRGIIERSMIGQIGAGWAISAMNNSNSLSILANTISGGSGGNGIDVGQSQSVRIRENTMECDYGYAIRAGGNAQGSGRVFGLNLIGNYIEQATRPLGLGEMYEVGGAVITGNYIANNFNPITKYMHKEFGIALGRVTNATITGNTYAGERENGTGVALHPFIKFFFVPDSMRRVDVPEYINGSDISNNTVSDVSEDYVFVGFTPAQSDNLTKINKVSVLFSPRLAH